MENFGYTTDTSKALRDISTSLFELRDALMLLSVTVKDWQFETDLDRRQKSEALVQDLLHKLGSLR